MRSNELIQRYSLGICSEEEVNELERRLREDEKLQDEFLREAEIDAHLRQEAQLGIVDAAPLASAGQQSQAIWKWVSGVSTLAATVLLALMILNFPPQQKAMAYPSLGHLTVEISRVKHNIWAAAADGDLNSVSNELNNRVSVDVKADCGLTPLHVATLFGQSEVAQLLLSSDADVSLTDSEGNTALHMASFLGRTDIVRLLLDAGADPELRNHLGFSSLDNVAITWNAALEDYYHHVEGVLKSKLDFEQLRADRPKILRLLASESAIPPDRVPSVSLWRAAMTGNTAAVEQHIRAGTDINAKEDLSGSTPLVVATTFGKVEVARILIEAGADLEARNNSGGTALHVGCFCCQPEAVELLLNAGADQGQRNNWQLTPLQVVTSEFDAELEGVYRHSYNSLNLRFDSQHVQEIRARIAEILRTFAEDESAANLNRPSHTALMYARECEKHLGPLPKFRFKDAREIPTYQNGKRVIVTEANLWKSLSKGDIPAAFGEAFQLGNRVGRYQGKKKDGSPNPDVVFVSFYRDGGLGVIGHNMKTGATCFLSVEDGTDVRGDVPTPDMPGYEKAWQPPSVVAQDGCTKCHMADPFLHTPWIDQVRAANDPDETLVPLIADADSPYFVIGEEFPAPPGRKPGEAHATIPKHLEGNKCVECHAPQCVPEFFNVKLDELKMSAPFHTLEKETRERWIKDRDAVRAYCRSLGIQHFDSENGDDNSIFQQIFQLFDSENDDDE
ncbi:MAG: hypothetical protein GY878_23045 [Fuerstiella sp.]|nr:hypothetical protein [Fuerstiella sp.]